MLHLNPIRTALVVGLFLGGWHAVWVIIVALGAGQAIYDFVLWAHMIHLPLTVGPFEMRAAVSLIVVTFAAGCILGWVFAVIWNALHPRA